MQFSLKIKPYSSTTAIVNAIPILKMIQCIKSLCKKFCAHLRLLELDIRLSASTLYAFISCRQAGILSKGLVIGFQWYQNEQDCKLDLVNSMNKYTALILY